MSVTLPIGEMDFLADSEQLFIDVYNLQFMPLNWAREDVEYLRMEVDENYPDLVSMWIRVDAYPTLDDTSGIVVRNGRYYDMSITLPKSSINYS